MPFLREFPAVKSLRGRTPLPKQLSCKPFFFLSFFRSGIRLAPAVSACGLVADSQRYGEPPLPSLGWLMTRHGGLRRKSYPQPKIQILLKFNLDVFFVNDFNKLQREFPSKRASYA